MSSVSSQPYADYVTQFNNLVRQVNTIQQQLRVVQSTLNIVPNPNSDGSNTNPATPSPPSTGGTSTGVDPVTGLPLPSAPPLVLQQGILPVTDLVVTPNAYLSDVYADVTWVVDPTSNAVVFDVIWGTANPDGTINLSGTSRCGGNSYRIMNLHPNTQYGVQVVASNVLGQSTVTPATGYMMFESTQDSTIPPPVSENGSVLLGMGATSIIVEFSPLTIEQAPDVANGAGVYLVEVTNDPTWATIVRQVYTSAWVVAFNDIFPNSTLKTAIAVVDDAGTSETFSDLSMLTPGAQFTALIDDEYILFNAPSGNTATIAIRNSGKSPLVNGPENHAIGANVVINSQTTWYARVCAIDTSNNQGPWSYSSGQIAGGITDSMIVGDINAAKITFGLMQGDRIEANTLTANAIGTGSITAATITLAGGSLVSGNPPNNGLVLNSQGLTFYSGGDIAVNLDAIGGNATFSGLVEISDPTTGNPILQMGTVGTGGAAVLNVYDPGGTLQASLGYIASGIYGIQVLNRAGVLQRVSGMVYSGPGSASSTTTTHASCGTSVTANVGPSGAALVTVSAVIGTTTTQTVGSGITFSIGISVSGGTAPAYLIEAMPGTSGDLWTVSGSASRVLTGLTQGDHTFAPQAWNDFGSVTIPISNVYVVVQPL